MFFSLPLPADRSALTSASADPEWSFPLFPDSAPTACGTGPQDLVTSATVRSFAGHLKGHLPP